MSAAYLHIPASIDLISTAYGWVVLGKVAIAMGLIALGAQNVAIAGYAPSPQPFSALATAAMICATSTWP